LCYSIFFGFKSSVVTDLTKMILLAVIGIGVTGMIVNGVGWSIVVSGLGGYSGEFNSLFDQNGWLVFSTFGLATFIGLLSGPFGDQALWQRAFAVKQEKVRQRAFLLGTFFFLIIPICMSIIGFAAAGSQFTTTAVGYVNLMFIIDQLPVWAVMAFAVMVLAGITSILDSKLSAVSSIAGHDIAKRLWSVPTDYQSIQLGKISMIVLSIAAVLIANIPKLTLVHLFLIYGSLRASTMMPTLLVMVTKRPLSEAGVFYGSITSLLFGVPLLTYGAMTTTPWATVLGIVLAVSLSGIISYIWTVVGKEKITYSFKGN
jgi:Na+/proline symporter